MNNQNLKFVAMELLQKIFDQNRKIIDQNRQIITLLNAPSYITAQQVKNMYGLTKKRLQGLRNGKKDKEGNYIVSPVLRDYKTLESGRGFLYNEKEIQQLFKS